jgi:hypothetical protein
MLVDVDLRLFFGWLGGLEDRGWSAFLGGRRKDRALLHDGGVKVGERREVGCSCTDRYGDDHEERLGNETWQTSATRPDGMRSARSRLAPKLYERLEA